MTAVEVANLFNEKTDILLEKYQNNKDAYLKEHNKLRVELGIIAIQHENNELIVSLKTGEILKQKAFFNIDTDKYEPL